MKYLLLLPLLILSASCEVLINSPTRSDLVKFSSAMCVLGYYESAVNYRHFRGYKAPKEEEVRKLCDKHAESFITAR